MGIPASILLHHSHLIYSDFEHGGIFHVWLESGKSERILDIADHHPHGLAQWNGTLLFTDPHSHQVKCLQGENVSVLAGCGSAGLKFGNVTETGLTQPSSIDGNNIFVCDTADRNSGYEAFSYFTEEPV